MNSAWKHIHRIACLWIMWQWSHLVYMYSLHYQLTSATILNQSSLACPSSTRLKAPEILNSKTLDRQYHWLAYFSSFLLSSWCQSFSGTSCQRISVIFSCSSCHDSWIVHSAGSFLLWAFEWWFTLLHNFSLIPDLFGSGKWYLVSVVFIVFFTMHLLLYHATPGSYYCHAFLPCLFSIDCTAIQTTCTTCIEYAYALRAMMNYVLVE